MKTAAPVLILRSGFRPDLTHLHTQLVITVTDAAVAFCILGNTVAAAITAAGFTGTLAGTIIRAAIAVFTFFTDTITAFSRRTGRVAVAVAVIAVGIGVAVIIDAVITIGLGRWGRAAIG